MLMNASNPSRQPPFWRSKPGIALGMLLVIGLFYLLASTTVTSASCCPTPFCCSAR